MTKSGQKILCVGVNYRPHIEEMGREIPDYPVVFTRFASSLVGNGEDLIHPGISEQYDFEGELAIVIGKPAHRVAKSEAFDVIGGYCCFMDGSVRDWQFHTPQFTAGKNFDRSGAIGEVVDAASVGDPTSLELITRVNGEEMQRGRLSDLVFDIPTLVEYCSAFTSLEPGDIIATGTPGGVGAARKPPVWLRPGDSVEVDIEGVGTLRNSATLERCSRNFVSRLRLRSVK